LNNLLMTHGKLPPSQIPSQGHVHPQHLANAWVRQASRVRRILLGFMLSLIVVAVAIWHQFDNDVSQARVRASIGSVLVSTACGLIEYQEVGQGVPLLMVHGSGGGYDQGMAFASSFARQGMRVIAVSRFGYLRTPMPADASAAAQADAHACLLDTLKIPRTAVIGASAGALSAMQLAIRHPNRVSALILIVPIAYRPGLVANSASDASALSQRILESLISSDFVYWVATHLAQDQLIQLVLATPPEVVASASPAEQARVLAMVNSILPISERAQGLINETKVITGLQPYDLAAIRAPTLLISARDDRYGTYANAQYTASQIANAKFVGYDQGGHLWVGHDQALRDEVTRWVLTHGKY
jgi:2-hydroxy-6-oxonona-2,4-dienedioate hydrolase